MIILVVGRFHEARLGIVRFQIRPRFRFGSAPSLVRPPFNFWLDSSHGLRAGSVSGPGSGWLVLIRICVAWLGLAWHGLRWLGFAWLGLAGLVLTSIDSVWLGSPSFLVLPDHAGFAWAGLRWDGNVPTWPLGGTMCDLVLASLPRRLLAHRAVYCMRA